MPIRSDQPGLLGNQPSAVLCRPACCKSPSLVKVTSSVNGVTNPASIFVRFSNNVVGLNGQTFVVTGPAGQVRGGVGFDPATLQAVFIPASPLAGTYTGTLSGLTDVNGCKIAPFVFTFSVCSAVIVVSATSGVSGGNTLVTVTFSGLRKLVSYTVNAGAPLTGATPAVGSVANAFVLNMGVTVGTNTLRVTVTDPAGGCSAVFQFSVNGGSITPVPPT